MSAVARRTVFLSGAALAALLTVKPATAAGPDAILIANCAEFGQRAATEREMWNAAHTDEECEAMEHVSDLARPEMAALLDLIVEAKATTLQGVLARTHALLLYEPEMADPNGFGVNGWNDTLARATIRDLLAVTGGMA